MMKLTCLPNIFKKQPIADKTASDLYKIITQKKLGILFQNEQSLKGNASQKKVSDETSLNNTTQQLKPEIHYIKITKN